MQDNTFITRIHIDKVRHIHDVDIILSDTECRHLILTGKNGSGKTSVLEAMKGAIQLEFHSHAMSPMNPFWQEGIELYCNETNPLPLYYFPAAHNAKIIQPVNIEKVHIQTPAFNASDVENTPRLLSYMLFLKYQELNAESEAEKQVFSRWFDNFTAALREIYDCQELVIKQIAKELTFKIEMPDREPFGFNEMADGYSAILNILAEILMQIDNGKATPDYDKPGICLIDEIETHLHVELQKRILPFLIKIFPKMQFFVTTHSPFVITSLDNAVVYDLEKNTLLENPSIYSYETVVEAYLDVGQYSNEIRNVFNRYRELCRKNTDSPLSTDEAEEFRQLISTLEFVPPASKELFLAFRTMENKRKKLAYNASK
ncbi:MAG: AAA family ATPase [Clostridiales Family XIII bacterium]|nr:AAA family ATPase [Clostridiales Family XIII bacterium]